MGSSMRVPGSSDTKETKTETEAKKARAEANQTEEMKSLVTYLLAHSKKMPPSNKPVRQFGYLKRDPADPGTGLLLREDVIKAQQELKDLKDDKGLNELYRDLHEIQGEYVDAVLRGESPDLKAFKDKQEAKITKCNAILEQLLEKDVATGVPKADPKIVDSITKQKKLLEELPSKIEATRSHLIDQLKREKQRYLGERGDKEINAKENMEDYMFSVYMKGKGKHASDRDKEIKDTLRKYGDVGDDALAGGKSVLTDDKGNKIAAKSSLGYRDAKKIITDEMERAEREPPHESFFIPFGKESDEVNYLIRRYKENGQWYLEAHMLDENRITEPKEFKDMVEELFRFQKFAGCETDVVKLSFGAAVYSKKYVNERADYILELIALLKEKGRQNPPTKKLELDEHAKNALLKCGKEKRRKVEDALRELEKQAATDQESMKDKVQSQIKDTTKIKTAITAEIKKDIAASTQAIVDSKDDNLLYNQLKSKGGFENLARLKEVLTDAKIAPKDSKFPPAEIAKAESEAIQALSKALDNAQKTLKEHIEKVKKVFDHNSNDPSLGELLKQLEVLDQNQRAIAARLEARCDGLMKTKDCVDAVEEGNLIKLEDLHKKWDEAIARDAPADEMEALHTQITALENATGGLTKDEIAAFKDNLGDLIKKDLDKVRKDQPIAINLSAAVNELGKKIDHAKAEKESALPSFKR